MPCGAHDARFRPSHKTDCDATICLVATLRRLARPGANRRSMRAFATAYRELPLGDVHRLVSVGENLVPYLYGVHIFSAQWESCVAPSTGDFAAGATATTYCIASRGPLHCIPGAGGDFLGSRRECIRHRKTGHAPSAEITLHQHVAAAMHQSRPCCPYVLRILHLAALPLLGEATRCR